MTTVNNFIDKISNEQTALLPAVEFRGEIRIVEHERDIAAACKTLAEQPVIGFDTETRPSFRPGVTFRVSLLQLSTPTVCYLFRLNKIPLAKPILQLLEDRRVLKIGADVAGDLRKGSTAPKMGTDIERIADQASDIAEITLHLHPDGARTVGVLDDLYAMGDIALHMVKDAIAAYVQVDLSTAAQVIARDDDCDAMFSRISKEIAAYIAAHPGDAETALDLFMIDKYLERLGDHAVNIAEWVEFLKTGVHKSRKIV